MRCNVGINPIYLADQHLVAEFRELPIVLGQMKHLKFQFKSTIPEQFTLGTGHISFFRNKLGYLHNRWNKIKNEMKRRGFKTHLNFDIPIGVLKENNIEIINWNPTLTDSMIVRKRIIEKFQQKLKPFYRYEGEYLWDKKGWHFLHKMLISELFEF